MPPAVRILRAMALCARGRAEGIAMFGDTPAAFLASLAPLIAFPLVATLTSITAHGGGAQSLSDLVVFLQAFDALLALPVVSHALARWWGREEAWLRYATAANWCHWLLEVAFMVAIFAAAVLAAFGLPGNLLLGPFLLAAAAYSLWLQFFLARRGLGLRRGRAWLLVIVGNVIAAMLIAGPALLRGQDAMV
ncbi:MAG TPA: hypothetical protein VJY39_16455 [Acidisphaera sp.]|nr:hypothetical protein [Acidisphaera sp.]